MRRARQSGQTGDDPPARPRPAHGSADRSPFPRGTSAARRARIRSRRLGLAAILLGAWPPGVTCHVAADGTLTSADPALDGIQLFHLGVADTAAVIALLREACGTPVGAHYPAPVPGGFPLPEPATAGSQNRQRVIPADPGTTRRPQPGLPTERIPPRRRTAPPGASSPAPSSPARHVTLLARSRPRPHRRPLLSGSSGSRSSARCGSPPTARRSRGGLRKARELAAFLAVHPDGVTPEAISEALWPESPPGHGASAAQPRAAQAPRPAPRRRRADRAHAHHPGRRTLPPRPRIVSTDVADFQAALETARHAPERPRPPGGLPASSRAVPGAAGRRRRIRVGRALRRDRAAPGPGRLDPHRRTPRACRPRPGAGRAGNRARPRPVQRVPLPADHAAAGRSRPARRGPPHPAPAGNPAQRARRSHPVPRPARRPPRSSACPCRPARGGGPQPPAPPRPAPAARQRPPGRQPAR